MIQMNRHYIIILSLVTVCLYALPVWHWFSTSSREPVSFAVDSASVPPDNEIPFMVSEFISPDPGPHTVHAGSICELAGAGLAAVWYGGTREGARDTVIYFSKSGPKKELSWTKPRVIVSRKSASQELNRHIKKLGNSIIFEDSQERLWLIYVTVTVGGWSGSSLNVKISQDGGANWTTSRRLVLSPFFNVSELVRNNPLPMSDGGFVIPIYHECLGRFPEILWIRPEQDNLGIELRKTRMAGGRAFIQPSVVASGQNSGTVFYRNLSRDRKVAMAGTGDACDTWSEPQALELPNPDSGLNALMLSRGRILLAFNDSKSGRHNLRLAISDDNGSGWTRVATLENTPGEEFSYPYMIRSRDGLVHLVYTWRRKHIRYVVFNEAWIRAQMEKQ